MTEEWLVKRREVKPSDEAQTGGTCTSHNSRNVDMLYLIVGLVFEELGTEFDLDAN